MSPCSYFADTIVAPATAPGQGGIGILRVSGPLALPLLERFFLPAAPGFNGFRPWTLHRGRVCDANGRPLDDALAVFMPGPRSFTGEDVAEWHCHGSPALLGLIVENLCAAGARLAGRGEFTQRAFLNDRMDLSQAEAVAELISAPGPEAARLATARLDGRLSAEVKALRDRIDNLRAQVCLAVDFPDDEVDAELTPSGFHVAASSLLSDINALISAFERTKIWRDGLHVVLAGPVNAGKSSLLNLLLGRERALVSAHPGTTRDYIEEAVRLGKLPLRIFDTAGLRDTSCTHAATVADPIEAEGIRRGRALMDQADAVLLLVDAEQPDPDLSASLLAELGPERTVLVWNKHDLVPPAPWFFTAPFDAAAARLCLTTRDARGLPALESALESLLGSRTGLDEPENDQLVPNLRQTETLRHARLELESLCHDVDAGVPWDLCAVHLDGVAAALEEVTGRSTPDEVLNRIFASFCIGK